MGNDHRTTRKRLDAFLQCAQGIDVDVISRLVEQEDVRLGFEGHGEVQPVAFTAGKHAALLLLVGTVEVEAAHVSAAVEELATDLELLIAPADDFPDSFLRVDVRVALVDVANFHRLSNIETSPIGLLFSHDHAEQRRLTRSVGTDDPYDARWRQVEIEVFNQQPLTKSFLQLGGLDDRIAQARSVGDGDGQTGFLFVGALGQHLFVVVDTGFVLGAPSLGRLAHPVQLAFQFFAALGFLLFLLGEALRLLLQPRGVIALVRNALSAV